MGAVHPLKISGHEAAQLELYQDSRHLQVPNERPDFSFSHRCYFRQKKVQTGSGELGHTLSLAKQLVQIQNLKLAGGRGVCTSGNPLKCLFTFSGTQRPRFQSRVFYFSLGLSLPCWGGVEVCYLRQKGGSAQMLLLEKQLLQFQQEPLFSTEVEEEVEKGVLFMSAPFIP